jgi:hypothetical protein
MWLAPARRGRCARFAPEPPKRGVAASNAPILDLSNRLL